MITKSDIQLRLSDALGAAALSGTKEPQMTNTDRLAQALRDLLENPPVMPIGHGGLQNTSRDTQAARQRAVTNAHAALAEHTALASLAPAAVEGDAVVDAACDAYNNSGAKVFAIQAAVAHRMQAALTAAYPALTAQVAALTAQCASSWIPIVQLPPLKSWVIVMQDHSINPLSAFFRNMEPKQPMREVRPAFVRSYWKDDDGSEYPEFADWILPSGSPITILENVTHWQSLPSAIAAGNGEGV